jgi:TolB protein
VKQRSFWFLRAIGAVALAVMTLSAFTPVAHATFPGRNGKLAYRAGRPTDNEYRIYLRSKAGEKALTADDQPAGSPSWRADGKRIVFTMSASIDDASDVWVMRPDGSGQRRLTDTPVRYEAAPVFSPDGKRIAFIRGENLIFTMRADGSGQKKLAELRGEVWSLSWSSDGVWLATTSFRSGQSDVIIVNVKTGKKRWVTATPQMEEKPDWSPDGTRLVFARLVDAGNHDLFTVRADGKRQRRLTTTATLDESYPAWSPDGTKIAYVQRTIAGNIREIAIMPNTSGAPPDTVYVAAGDDFEAAWQPRR